MFDVSALLRLLFRTEWSVFCRFLYKHQSKSALDSSSAILQMEWKKPGNFIKTEDVYSRNSIPFKLKLKCAIFPLHMCRLCGLWSLLKGSKCGDRPIGPQSERETTVAARRGHIEEFKLSKCVPWVHSHPEPRRPLWPIIIRNPK